MTDPIYTHRWQTDAHRILGELIQEGHKAGLPPLTWTLAITGALTGEAPGLAPDEDPHAAVTAWAAHLGATVAENRREDGRLSLYAPFSRDGKRWGALRAEIFPDLDDETPVVFEVEQSGADSHGWDPDDPYGNVEEYERGAH